ncbi:hypothetical protein GIB67_011208 [Kingdonia uniflora]|uniref:EF-hand domain-containing protein n=1 Tax=Kingdonia uniflora TaxID=39325 RepID=A0A7J7M401_9MAGN|nr:hypothetical protein GIB67_011208 [Kingdonia uniflora]
MGIRSFLSKRKKSKSSTPTENESVSSSFSQISRTEIDEYECVFKKFDVNGDGKISWSELGAIMASLGHAAIEDDLKKMVSEVDGDGDGYIDLEEFIELNTKGVDETNVLEDLRNAFSMFDLDNNGLISAEELQKVMRSLGDYCSIADCKKMISGVDSDGDGAICFSEFEVMMSGSSSSLSTILASTNQD